MSSSLKQVLEKWSCEFFEKLKQVVDINSYTYNGDGVDAVGEIYTDWFTELGFETEAVPSTLPDCGRHLFFEKKGKSPFHLMLLSHLDTVFPEKEEEENHFFWKEDGDKIYGPGVLDIKGGSVLIYFYLKALKTHYPDIFDFFNWTILHNATEEPGGNDFAELARLKVRQNSLACLVYEGGENSKNPSDSIICVSRRGTARFKIECYGRSAHSGSGHKKGVNAVRELCRVVEKIEQLTQYEKDITFSVGVIEGGTAVNTVPPYAYCLVDVRANNPHDFAWAKAQLLKFQGEGELTSVIDGFKSHLTVERQGEFPPWPTTKMNEELSQTIKTVSNTLGRNLYTQTVRGGTSDGNFLYDLLPTIDLLGPNGANHHCSIQCADKGQEQEYILKSSVVPQLELNIALICSLYEKALKTSV